MTVDSWWSQDISRTVRAVDTDLSSGLTDGEVRLRQQKYSNVVELGNPIQPWRILLNQFTDTMVLVLLGATVISGIIGDMADALTIMTIVVINAILGFVQEYRAERSLEEIKKMAAPEAKVIRNGQRMKVPAADLVPGDLVLLEPGDKVPADLRLAASSTLETDESALTGESVPVGKQSAVICLADCPLADRVNMAFMGTSVTRGRGRGIVVGTGMNTVMGEIAGLMMKTGTEMTPLQIKLDALGKTLIVICLAVCLVVTLLGITRGEDIMIMLMAGISLAVAAIPEGLPAIVTVVLALGVQRMARRNAIVRKLPAVETLGCTTVICSDKTGTLTRNQMTVKKVAVFNQAWDVEGEGYHIAGNLVDSQGQPARREGTLAILMDIALNCNNSNLKKADGDYEVLGDPTEAALLVMAAKTGQRKRETILREIPFDSERKMMSVVIEPGNPRLLVKGALDVIINSCSFVRKGNRVVRITAADKDYFLRMQAKWANGALRILGFASRTLSPGWDSMDDPQLETDLVLIGMCGMIDPPRAGTAKAVRVCLDAGIVPVMITGDHPQTAAAIAREIGISHNRDVVTGQEIDQLTDQELYHRTINNRVFARVSPQHKNRIVSVLKKNNQVVAMTGDGVNDAPAIKAADIGIAMGISGTQVSREASAMILTDDDFSTIVEAVYQGRAIYDNIRKFIRYLLGCNIGEILVMLLASLMALPLPLLPIQLLWVNLVTDGLPAMALGIEAPEPGIMKRQPRPKNEGVFANGLGWIVLGRGLYIAAITITAFVVGYIWGRTNGADALPLARSMAFTTLVLGQLFYVFECRSERLTPFELGFFRNRYLVGAVLVSVCMQLSALYIPALQAIFKTVPLAGWEWVLIISLAGFKLWWRLIGYILPGYLKWDRAPARI
ncbi:MAG: calcium-translocating P-type ATPase, SERCA-type [Syntrophomonadaceae bacterium]